MYFVASDKPGAEKTEMHVVSIGVTDGMFTEVNDPALPVGTKVITDETEDKNKKKN